MRTVGFLLLGTVLTIVLNLVLATLAGLLGALVAKAGASWPPRDAQARTQLSCLVILMAIAAGFGLSWFLVM